MCVMRRQRPANLPAARFAIDTERGLLELARQEPSPNCDDRPPGVEPDLIVVHGISLPPGEFGGPWIDLLFTNALPPDGHPYFAEVAGLHVSAHLLIRRTGEVVQYVPFQRRAWHAGVSSWAGRERCNDYSIGIELEGADHSPYESTQYAMLARVIAELCRSYPQLTPDRIVGHSDVAPGRKSDPGPSFDWPRLRSLVQFELEVAPP
jgi:N-acetyl-anhydromuramoyl-L-alanine amidase